MAKDEIRDLMEMINVSEKEFREFTEDNLASTRNILAASSSQSPAAHGHLENSEKLLKEGKFLESLFEQLASIFVDNGGSVDVLTRIMASNRKIAANALDIALTLHPSAINEPGLSRKIVEITAFDMTAGLVRFMLIDDDSVDVIATFEQALTADSLKIIAKKYARRITEILFARQWPNISQQGLRKNPLKEIIALTAENFMQDSAAGKDPTRQILAGVAPHATDEVWNRFHYSQRLHDEGRYRESIIEDMLVVIMAYGVSQENVNKFNESVTRLAREIAERANRMVPGTQKLITEIQQAIHIDILQGIIRTLVVAGKDINKIMEMVANLPEDARAQYEVCAVEVFVSQ